MHRRLLLYFITLGVSVVPAIASAQVVATVGDTKITLADFKMKYDEVKRQTINAPPPELFLEDLVRFEMGVQEAEKVKLRQDPIVQERIRTELYKALLEKSIGAQIDKIKVNESEMQSFYKGNPEIRTNHILIEFKATSTPEEKIAAKKRAEEIYKEVKSSKRPFAELVKLYTDDTATKNNGGDVGYQSRLTLVPNYYEAALRLPMQGVSGLIETRYGFHIIQLTGKKAYQQANKRQIRAAVYDQKRKIAFDNYFAKIRRNYKVNLNKDLVKSL